MLLSMTGYGKAESIRTDRTVKVEIRSLNNRYFDLNLRMPSSLREKETEVRTLLNEKLQRGKVDCLISLENGNEAPVSINHDLVRRYYNELRLLAKELNASKKELLSAVIQMPEVLGSAKTVIGDQDWPVVRETLLLAVEDIGSFRAREGEQMEMALVEHVAAVLDSLQMAEKYEKERLDQVRGRFLHQLQELQSPDESGQNRFEQELLYYIERMDFTEEKVRLRSHCDFFLKTMNDKESNGRRLNFIAQEMGREINTLGSKANHAEIQKVVVAMKDELEKIKEQLLNVL